MQSYKPPASWTRDFDTADADLNKSYQSDLKKVESEASYVAKYKKTAQSAQHEWIKYRDTWENLASQFTAES